MIKDDTTHILMNIIAFEEDENLSEYIELGVNLLKEHANGQIIETKIIK